MDRYCCCPQGIARADVNIVVLHVESSMYIQSHSENSRIITDNWKSLLQSLDHLERVVVSLQIQFLNNQKNWQKSSV